ncbi:MAG: carbon-nitrogen hydrolase family protein [Planctomycetia bacterium]|nr:carbon-nitrogen hydrolase family protein [Planctomycetia bacterium]
METGFRVAAVQMSSGEDVPANLSRACALAEEAARGGARLVALPELFSCLGRPETILAAAEDIPGPTSQTLCELARRLGITLVAGSFCERSPEPTKGYNTSLLIGPDGAILARYRKRRLFDIEIPGVVKYRESGWLAAGDAACVSDTPCGRVGQTICYDLRFPELFRELADDGAQLVCVPSAFTLATGRDHWEVLLRARAIENQLYVIAPNQFGQHSPALVTYGSSMIVDPWGTVLATAADGEGVIAADVDLARIAEVRERLPALAQRGGERR